MIIVTGAAGFIGSNLTKALVDARYQVMAIDDLSFGNPDNIPDGTILFNIDFDLLREEKYLSEDNILIHCATSNIIYAIDHPIETFKNNAERTIELFSRFKGKIIYLSTSSVYGNADQLPIHENAPIKTYNAYDTSKRIAELYLQQRSNYTTLRLSNVYGFNQLASNPYCGIIGKLVDAAIMDKCFHIYGSGNDTRDYTFVSDVVSAVMMLIESEALNTELNIGTARETSVNQLINALNQLMGIKLNTQNIKGRAIDGISRRSVSYDKAKYYLGWKPAYDIKGGLAETIKWYINAQSVRAI